MGSRAFLFICLAAPALWAGGDFQLGPAQGRTPVFIGGAEKSAAGDCRKCHQTIYAQWSKSAHARAYVDPIFQLEYRAKKHDWCLHCHAPTDAQIAGESETGPRLEEGVGCAACHIRDGKILAQKKSPRSPHDTLVTEVLGKPQYCAECHEFNFPRFAKERDELVGFTNVQMQSTVEENRAYFGTKTPNCRSCHFEKSGHEFPGIDLLPDAYELKVCREKEALVVKIRNMSGHALPTGGVNRNLQVRVWNSYAPEAMASWFIGRKFAHMQSGGKRVTYDGRIGPRKSARKKFALGPKLREINLELIYGFVDERIAEEVEKSGVVSERSIENRRVRITELELCTP